MPLYCEFICSNNNRINLNSLTVLIILKRRLTILRYLDYNWIKENPMYILKEIFYILMVMLIVLCGILGLIGVSILAAPIFLAYALYVLIRDYKVDKKHRDKQ